ncbi:MAG: ABC transporter substrate-binding protein [Thermoplasmatales archaeon]
MGSNDKPADKATGKKHSRTIIAIVVVIVVIVIIAGTVSVITLHKPTKVSRPLSIAPSSSAIEIYQGASITFSTGIPSGTPFTKAIWNFGDGTTYTTTSGVGTATHTYKEPGTYLVNLVVYNNTSLVSNNASLIEVTVLPGLGVNPAAVFGPIIVNENSAGNINQTIPEGGWINMSFAGLTAASPETVGSTVPSDTSYTITGIEWNIDNGTQVVNSSTGSNEGILNYTFSISGLHTVDLIITSSGPSGTVTGQYLDTVAVGNYAIQKVVSKVAVNTNEIVDASYQPGGPDTFDPSLSDDIVSQEVTFEIYQSLLAMSNTSVNTYLPQIAVNVPTVSNGEITMSHFMGTNSTAENITFYINTTLQFSNGDHVTPYDVYVSFARLILFANDLGPGWGMASDLIPGQSVFGPFNESFYWVHHAVTWNNTTDSVTFHLLPSVPTWLPNTSAVYAGQDYGPLNQSYEVSNWGGAPGFLEGMTETSDGGGTTPSIMDSSWLVEHGAFPANNSAAYAAFANTTSGPGSINNENQYVKWNPMGTGPYELKLYEPSQEAILVRNPYYHQTPGLLPPSKIVPELVIEYLTDESTAIQQIESGQATFATGAFPVDATSIAVGLEKQGILASSVGTSLSFNFFGYNFDVNITGAKVYDSQTNIPATFFANLSVRKAFSYAFNESYWINVANSDSGITFMKNLTGVIPAGVTGYSANLTSQYPEVYNLTMAKYYWDQTNYSKSGIKLYFPMFNWEGNPSVDEMYTNWANAIGIITNGQVVAEPIDVSFDDILTYSSYGAGADPMPIYFLGWSGGSAAVYTSVFYAEYGFQPFCDGITPPSAFNSTSYPGQWQTFTEVWNYLNLAAETSNVTQATNYYYQAQKIALSLYLYVGTSVSVSVLYYSSAVNPSSLSLTLLNGATDIFYYDVQYTS